jgi:peptide/nickel transport system substrate-binding protein
MTRYIESVSLNENDQVVITLTESFNGLLGSLACPFFAIMNEEYVSSIDVAQNKQAPIGTGAYKLKEWVKGQSIELEAFEEYFQGAPAIKTVKLKPVPDKNAAFIALESGEIDTYIDINPADIPSVEKNENLSLYSTSAANALTLSLNSAIEPLSDKNLRLAIAHAINREDIVTAALEGNAASANSVIPPELEGYSTDTNQPAYDVELAKQFLSESAYPNGLTLSLKHSEDSTHSKVSQIIQDNLKQIGIEVVIDTMEHSTFSADIYEKSNFELSIGSWSAMFLDAYSLAFCQFHSESFTYIGNTAQISDPALDALLNDAATTSAEEKVAKYNLVSQYVADNALMLPVAYTNATLVANSGLKGVSPSPLGVYYIKNFSW